MEPLNKNNTTKNHNNEKGRYHYNRCYLFTIV